MYAHVVSFEHMYSTVLKSSHSVELDNECFYHVLLSLAGKWHSTSKHTRKE